MANGGIVELDRVGATQSFTSFINKAAEKSPSLVTPQSEGGGFGGPGAYEKIWEEGNKPFIKQYDRGELASEWQNRGYSDITTDRAFFTQSKNYPTEPDTLHLGQKGISDFMAEMGHAIDYNISEKGRKQMGAKSAFEHSIWGEGVYGQESRHGLNPVTGDYVQQLNPVSGRQTNTPTDLESGMYYPQSKAPSFVMGDPMFGTDRYVGFRLWPGETLEKYQEGVTPQSDVPTEFHAHNVTEKRLWEGLKEGKYE